MKNNKNDFFVLIKDHTKGFYILCILLFIIIWYLVYSNILLNNEVKDLKIAVTELKENINNNSIKVSKDSSNESISDFYSNTISRVDTLVGVIGVIVSLFGLTGVYLSWVNLNIGKEFQDKLNKIDSVSRDVEVLNGMKCFISGLTYSFSKKYQYAIEEFEKGFKNNNSAINQIQLASIYADLGVISKDNSGRMLNDAISYLKVINENEDNKTKAEFFYTKGCVYGTKAYILRKNNKKTKKTFYEKFKLIFYKNDVNNMSITELYEKSIKYLKKAIKLRNDQYRYYTNTALTYHYINNLKEAIRYFNLAKKTIEFDEIDRWLNIDIFDIFSYEDLSEMGRNKFNEYRYKVEGVKDSEEDFERRLNKIK